MQKKQFVMGLFIAFLTIILVSCSGTSGEPHHIGHVIDVDKSNYRILVASALTDEEVLNHTVEELLELDQQRGASAVWYTGSVSKFEVGDRVQIWIRGSIAESYPAQAEAKKIEKFEVGS